MTCHIDHSSPLAVPRALCRACNPAPPVKRSAEAAALATPLYRHRVVRDRSKYSRKQKHRKALH
jgi:hypothetical protein